MSTGRTVTKHQRVYVDGYDLSGYASQIGPLGWTFDLAEYFAFSDAIKTYLPGHGHNSLGTYSGIFDNTATSGLHALLATPGAKHTVTVAIGIRAAPAAGDPTFSGQYLQGDYLVQPDGEAVMASLAFEQVSQEASSLNYSQPWGVLLNANTARTAANSSTGQDHPGAAATAYGGLFVYHVTAGNGTATLSVDDSADNSSFLALSGATSGSLNCAAPSAGMVALGKTATVRRYLRWQLALGTATTVTFVSTFIRAYGL
jgi:hypothetical protein